MKLDENDRARFSNVYLAYVYDLGYVLKERALQARAQRDSARAGGDRAFEAGRLTAFYEVISTMQQNAEGLGIPLAVLRLDDVVPDRDLV
jgi:hypothetical protein